MIVCAICGEIKRETNHWIASWISRADTEPMFQSRQLQATDSSAEINIACGENCAHKLYQQFLERLRLTQ